MGGTATRGRGNGTGLSMLAFAADPGLERRRSRSAFGDGRRHAENLERRDNDGGGSQTDPTLPRPGSDLGPKARARSGRAPGRPAHRANIGYGDVCRPMTNMPSWPI